MVIGISNFSWNLRENLKSLAFGKVSTKENSDSPDTFLNSDQNIIDAKILSSTNPEKLQSQVHNKFKSVLSNHLSGDESNRNQARQRSDQFRKRVEFAKSLLKNKVQSTKVDTASSVDNTRPFDDNPHKAFYIGLDNANPAENHSVYNYNISLGKNSAKLNAKGNENDYEVRVIQEDSDYDKITNGSSRYSSGSKLSSFANYQNRNSTNALALA